jgi:hypothetical protein
MITARTNKWTTQKEKGARTLIDIKAAVVIIADEDYMGCTANFPSFAAQP